MAGEAWPWRIHNEGSQKTDILFTHGGISRKRSRGWEQKRAIVIGADGEKRRRKVGSMIKQKQSDKKRQASGLAEEVWKSMNK